MDVIEPAAWRAIWATLTNPDTLLRLAEDHYERSRQPQTADVAALQRERTKISGQIKEAQRMMHEFLISHHDGAAMIRDDRARLAEIEQQLAAAGSQVLSMPSRQQIEAFCREFQGKEPGRDAETVEEAYDERRPILESIQDLHMRYLKPDLEISGRIPFMAVKSTTSNGGPVEKNSVRGVSAEGNSFSAIPFILKVRVA